MDADRRSPAAELRRAEYLESARDRALAYIDAGELMYAFVTFCQHLARYEGEPPFAAPPPEDLVHLCAH